MLLPKRKVWRNPKEDTWEVNGGKIMAEFNEIARQARRMCNAYDDDCEGCPLCGRECERVPGEWGDKEIATFERIVMDWAANTLSPSI